MYRKKGKSREEKGGVSASCEKGCLTYFLCNLPQNPFWFLSCVTKLNFTYQHHSKSNKRPPACGVRSNSTTQRASSPLENPWDNPIISIHFLFFRLIFKIIPTEKGRHAFYPLAAHYQQPTGPLLPCQKRGKQRQARTGCPRGPVMDSGVFHF